MRGSIKIEYTLARMGAERLWDLMRTRDYVQSLGALTGNQAVQQVKAGLEAIYLSGWQVAADANLAGEMYPDQSLYPANSVPHVVKRINQALQRADQIHHAEGKNGIYWFAPIMADAEAGFGGAQRLRADEGHDRGWCRGRPLRGPALLREEVRAHGWQGPVADGPGDQEPDLCAAGCGRARGADGPHGADGRRRGEPDHLRRGPGGRAVPHRRADGGGLLRGEARPGLRDSTQPRLCAIRGRGVVRDLRAEHRGSQGVRRSHPRRVPWQAPRLQLLALVQLEAQALRRGHRHLPGAARRDGLQVPVHHPGGLPLPQLQHVRAGARLS